MLVVLDGGKALRAAVNEVLRPWLAGAVAPAAAAFRAPVADTAGWPPGSERALRVRTPLTWSGVRSGWRSSTTAATPETTGAAIEVPPAGMYWPAATQVGHRPEKALAGASWRRCARRVR